MVTKTSIREDIQIPATGMAGKTVIAVGSTNPVKIRAVQSALNDETFHVISYSARSGVRPQPLSDEETIQGAVNRAKDCLNNTNSTLAIGLEGGIVFLKDQTYLCHWGAIADRDDKVYFTNAPLILLPREYREPLLHEQNLDAMLHHLTGIESLGRKEGAIGVFTQNRLNREQALAQIVKVIVGQYFYYQGV